MPNCKLCSYSTMVVAGPQGQAPASPGLTCRLNPPTVSVIGFPTQQGLAAQAITSWPQVQADDWCSHFDGASIAVAAN